MFMPEEHKNGKECFTGPKHSTQLQIQDVSVIFITVYLEKNYKSVIFLLNGRVKRHK